MGIFNKSKNDKQAMNKKEYKAFLDSCYVELQKKQERLFSEFGLGHYDDFWFDQLTETIQFKKDGEIGLEFKFVLVGSWSSNSNSWMWAWANTSVAEEVREKSAAIKELAAITGSSVFEEEAFGAEEITAHELTAMAVHHLGALGMYIAPSGNKKVFMALMETGNQ